jgi:hypothetical protein
MNCLVRIYPQSDQEKQKRWSITNEYDGNSCRLVVKRCDISGGWDEPFSVSLRNITGSSMNYEVPKSIRQTLKIPINPFIGLSLAIPRADWKIPPIIFQTWRAGEITPEMKLARQSFLDQDHYKYICWNDEECLKFLHVEYGERYAKAYSMLVPGAYRADFWRYCVLYKFGGVYADAKTTCLRPLDEIIRPTDELVLVRDIPVTCLLNGFIACQPGHQLLKLAMEKTLENIEARAYGDDPLDICGPHLFGKMFCKLLSTPEDCLTLGPAYTPSIQILGRSKDKKYIISPEGEPLLEKEYDSYYKNDINVQFHYPALWASKLVYKDQLPVPKK